MQTTQPNSAIERAQQNNQILTQVGPGTAMGTALRRFWIPALLSSEIAQPDSAPVRRMEWMELPSDYVHVSRWLQRSNWVQGMEGEIDSSHISFLHKSDSLTDLLARGAALADDGAPIIFIK